MLLDISNEDLEETLLTLQQVKAMRLFNRMRTEAERHGFLSEKEIEAEIQAARAELLSRKSADEEIAGKQELYKFLEDGINDIKNGNVLSEEEMDKSIDLM